MTTNRSKCIALQNTVFQPSMRLISAITNAFPAQVTTTFDHNYVTGTIVRFDLPPSVGMLALNQQTATIVVTSPTTFLIPINTINYGPFVIPTDTPWANEFTCPQVVPIGEVTAILTAAVQNVLPYPAQ